MTDEHLYWLGFSAFNGIGPKRFALLASFFGSAKKAWEVSREDLLSTGLGITLVENFVNFRQRTDVSSLYLRLREKKVECYFSDEKNYPECLKNIDDPPFVLYVKGAVKPSDRLSVAIVGSRKMTSYGRQVTESFSGELAGAGVTIVSGLARGVDTVAHRSALAVSAGRTIAVLACGLDMVYPPENQSLADRIADGRGAVVSEYPLGMQAMPGNFPARNRIIAGLSLATVVVEGDEKSGSLITARHAVEQGREVYAVPGPITSPNSAGPAYLIKMGAKLLWRASDILTDLDIVGQAQAGKAREVIPENREEELLFSLLAREQKHIDQLARESGLSPAEAAGTLSLMEIKGMVKDFGGGNYGKT